MPYWNQSMNKLHSFFLWLVARFAGVTLPSRCVLHFLAGLLLGFPLGLAAECGDTYQAAQPSIDISSRLLTLADTLSMEGCARIICGDSYRSRNDISSAVGAILHQYLQQGSAHFGFWNSKTEEPRTFIYSLPIDSTKTGYRQNGTKSLTPTIPAICTLELESSLCEAAEEDQ